jgi:hypothetical protein
MLRRGCEALEAMRIRTLSVGASEWKVQCNPARRVSSLAGSETSRACFLCSHRLPLEQESLSLGDYLLLCNPYPIFPEHFTLASRRHRPQRIGECFGDFLHAARSLEGLTLFYNGPQSGASAPDHLHFQAVTGGYMPLEEEVGRPAELLYETDCGSLCLMRSPLRNAFILRAQTLAGACGLFARLYAVLQERASGDAEPRMNLFGRYGISGGWEVVAVPRKAHRPRQFYARGAEQMLVSPGAADMGGVLVTTRLEDFEKVTPALLCDLYAQLAYVEGETDNWFSASGDR